LETIKIRKMKKFFLSAFILFAASAAFAKSPETKSVQFKVVPKSVTYCETRSCTVCNNATGEEVTVSCTKCADSQASAGILATVCAEHGAQAIAGSV
jgi:hypothetical protein